MRFISVFMAVVILFAPLPAIGEVFGLKAGVILPLTGVLAEYGVAAKNGMELAAEDIRKEGGVPPYFLFEDSRYDPKTALAAFQKLIDVDEVAVVFDWGSATSLAIAPVAEARKVPFVSATVVPDISVGKSYVLRVLASSDSFARAILRAVRREGVKELDVVKVQAAYYDQMFDSLEHELRSDETLTVVYSDQGAISDFKTVVAKLRIRKPKMLALFLFPGQLSAFCREMATQRLRVATVGADSFESKKEVYNSAGTMNGAMFVNLGSSPTFHSHYTTRFGNDVQMAFAGNAYDFGRMLYKAHKFSAEESFALDDLIALVPFEGVNGKYTFIDEPRTGRALESPVYIKKIVDGKFVTLSE